mmetsp:Transcript_37707/g.81756  ORF Transcript_37707/g.81756 Transcript_37707/m.81756 type:complete len:90 (+) Transcript_37707:687-956(+)
MGTNYREYILEGLRILKRGGVVLIAEVKSRFVGDAEEEFIRLLQSLGLVLKKRDKTNKMFVVLKLVYCANKKGQGRGAPSLKPCLYKRR